MTTQADIFSEKLAAQPADSIMIKRIEMFVLPSVLPEPSSYRICLKVTSDIGLGWSELFIKRSEKPCDWTRWSSMLLRFIGIFPLAAPSLLQRNSMIKDERLVHLFAAAAPGLVGTHSFCPFRNHDWDEAVLFKQAISYISLF
ncbi:hypothetical protein [Paenibacillus sp. FJAT-27812]|uniref:hypothetical protein n=1 Tax=Paenibacillus sp. FJAT-27812 TaxID=1684143 RepID=UPI0006A7C2BA|nr:hypothetical protein [Paenibacillus sp. FJAT-27812]